MGKQAPMTLAKPRALAVKRDEPLRSSAPQRTVFFATWVGHFSSRRMESHLKQVKESPVPAEHSVLGWG
jgi:hypothetical protein